MVPLINRIQIDETTGCWNWRGKRLPTGYGIAHWKGRPIYAHRLSAILWLQLPEHSTMYVLHHCDNPPCFNPKHLFIGTAGDNLKDCASKGRHHNTIKTACPRGHLYSELNTRRYHGSRFCRMCHKMRYERKT
jgi:hypothetical protein